MKLTAFAKKHKLSFSFKTVSSNPSWTDYAYKASHYDVRIGKGKKSMHVLYSQGPGIKHEPRLEDVLDSLASDVSFSKQVGYSYSDFLDEFGNTDSAQHRKTWRAINKEADALMRVLGPQAYEELERAERL